MDLSTFSPLTAGEAALLLHAKKLDQELFDAKLMLGLAPSEPLGQFATTHPAETLILGEVPERLMLPVRVLGKSYTFQGQRHCYIRSMNDKEGNFSIGYATDAYLDRLSQVNVAAELHKRMLRELGSLL